MRYQRRIRRSAHYAACFISKIMPPHFTLHTVRGFVITSAADFAATQLSPLKFTTHRARILLIFRKRCDGTITGSITLLHLRTPKNSVSAAKFGERILDGRSTVTGNGKPHRTAEKTNTQKSLACTDTMAKYPCVQKSKKYTYIIIVQVTVQGTLIRYLQALSLLLCT
jgi:hypothetical protein